METKNYFFHPEKKILKQGFLLEDEDKNIVYEAKMIKQHLLGAMQFSFINHITNKEEEHKVGHTITFEQNNGDMSSFLSTKSYFKFDGKNIWDYLHEKGIRIDSKMFDKSVGMTYDITLEGKDIATVVMVSPNGGKFLTGSYWYNVTTSEENLDLVFLVIFAIARTEQAFYN